MLTLSRSVIVLEKATHAWLNLEGGYRRMIPLVKCLRANTTITNAKKVAIWISTRYQGQCQHTSVQNIVKSPLPDIKVPDLLLHEYLFNGLERWHDKTAFECLETKKKFTYAEVNKKSDAFAGFLQSLGLQKGDTIVIVLPNVPEYLVVLIGSLKAGVLVSTCNPAYTANEIKKQLIDCNAKLVVTLNGLYLTIRQAVDGMLPEHSSYRQLPIVAINHTENESLPSGCIRFNEVVSKEWPRFRVPTIQADDVCLLPYSSGTTGLPKGVQLTHRNLVANSLQTESSGLKLSTETHGSNQDVVPIMLPMFHIYGLGVIGIHLFVQGVKFITLSKFTTDAFAQTLHQRSPSMLFVVPPMIHMLLNNPILKLEKLIGSVRAIVSAAAPLGVADIERFHKRTQGAIPLLQAYGMTEAAPVTHKQSFALPNGIKIGGSGVIIPNTQCKICPPDEPDGLGLGPNESGELLIKGPQVMKGYLNNEEATRATISPDGWLRTGDIAHYDEDGHFYITDRLKELIKVNGFQVAPAELEEILRGHPAIADAAVVGVSDGHNGEVPKAYVVLRQDIPTSVDDIHAYMDKNVVKYKQLRGGIVSIAAIPKNASGKILRRILKDF